MSASLPAPAQARLRAIRTSANDAAALHGVATETLRALMARADDPETSDEQRDALAAEIDAARDVQARRAARRANDQQVIAQVERYLSALPAGAVLTEWPDAVGPIDQDLDDIEELLVDVRAQITLKQGERRAVELAPLPPEVLKERARAFVRDLGGAAAPRFLDDGSPSFEPRHMEVGHRFGLRDTLALLAWLDPDGMIAALDAEIAARRPGSEPLTPNERTARLSEIDAELLGLERQEEQLVLAGQGRGLDVMRRPQADPRAVLGIRVERRRRAAA